VGAGNSTDLAKGISIALNATLLGLLTAIPSLVAWSYYSRRIEALSIDMATVCEEFLRRQFHRPTSEPAPANSPSPRTR
jgi:biopolymer transport protein ExbB